MRVLRENDDVSKYCEENEEEEKEGASSGNRDLMAVALAFKMLSLTPEQQKALVY